MLRLPAFDLHEPKSLEEALALLLEHGGDAMPIAGGTDLLPNMKHELFTPKVLVSLSGIASLRTVEDLGHAWRLGAGCTLDSMRHLLFDDDHLSAQAAKQLLTPVLTALRKSQS